ncbi:MAG: tetratricopeptide repeat protein [Caldilineaceae bacterium SB0675_bin_29]|uniref:Tetratricopeptide repeat protein n=1 Tax=Caldilineaceae bacterium SB0675_bin_29 TaxID=2605266 RepID=A0A6B1G662_9CHLR|nr:tetratricopeptide repeat protein [Caldilineaceae bacterium SB0675_bin_29]
MTDENLQIRHNLGVYRLRGFSGRDEELNTLCRWLFERHEQPALAISGGQGNGKSTLATAAAWQTIHHFPDGIIWVGAAGRDRFRMYDIVRTLDTVLGTTLTRVSEDRWGIGILEQLYRRRRLLILDELSGATDREIRTLAEIISHLHDTENQSHILLIDRDIHPEFAELVGDRHLQLDGLPLSETVGFVHARAPETVRDTALRNVEGLHRRTGGRPLSMRLVLGLLMDFGLWSELDELLAELPAEEGVTDMSSMAGFAVENFAAFWPEAGLILDRLVSAAGGATYQALTELFTEGMGTEAEKRQTFEGLVTRALVEVDLFDRRIVVQPVVRRYLVEGAVMLGEDWHRQHASYYLQFAQRYQELPIQRWKEIDPFWGNVHWGADWATDRVERIFGQSVEKMVEERLESERLRDMPINFPDVQDDLKLMRDYALALAHYAFWRHPPGIWRWLCGGAVASIALGDAGDFGWMLANIGRQRFFNGEVEEAIEWLQRALRIFDERDMLMAMAYGHTDLGTSFRVLEEPRQALDHFWLAFEAAAQLGDPRSLAPAYMNLGSAYLSLNNFERAIEQHRKALRVALRLGDEGLVASAHNNLGLAMEGMAMYAEAQRAYESALTVFQRNHDDTGVSTCYNNLGSVCYARQDFAAALDWYEKDLELSDRRGAWMDKAATLHNLGHVALEQQNHEQAAEYFRRSRELYAAFQLEEYVAEEDEMLAYVDAVASPNRSQR